MENTAATAPSTTINYSHPDAARHMRTAWSLQRQATERASWPTTWYVVVVPKHQR